MPDDVREAEEHLKALQRISVARLRAANNAAKNAGLTLVDAQELAFLRELHAAAVVAWQNGRVTRDYKDVAEVEGNNGKRFLVQREDARAVWTALSNLPDAPSRAGIAVELRGE